MCYLTSVRIDQEEIGLFGALKTIDVSNEQCLDRSYNTDVGNIPNFQLSKNKLTTLPRAFSDLICLTHLDLSHCGFTSLPSVLATLPALISLNISHNALTSLSFAFPPADVSPPVSPRSQEEFYAPQRPTRPHTPFPSLQVLLAAHNSLTAPRIGVDASASSNGGGLPSVPRTLVKLDLNHNPLHSRFASSAGVVALFDILSRVYTLKELYMRSSGLHDAALSDLRLSGSSSRGGEGGAFSILEALDVGDNDGLSEACVRRTILASRINAPDSVIVAGHLDIATAQAQAALAEREKTNHHNANKATSPLVRLVVGRHVIKEAWEIESERRAALRRAPAPTAEQEQEEDLGLGRPEARVRRTMGRERVSNGNGSGGASHNGYAGTGGRGGFDEDPSLSASPSNSSSKFKTQNPGETPPSDMHASELGPSRSLRGPSELLEKYYDAPKRTLRLPAAIPAKTRGGVSHIRAQSLAVHSGNGAGGTDEDMLLPRATFPHALIVVQPWSSTLRVLKLSNRRTEVAFLLSTFALDNGNSAPDWQLGAVEELGLDGCNLGSRVKLTCTRSIRANPDGDGSASAHAPGAGEKGVAMPSLLTHTDMGEEPKLPDVNSTNGALQTKEDGLLGVLHRIFPSLATLDLSDNALTSMEGVGALFLEGGLRVLRVRGNKLDEAALTELADIGGRIHAGDGDASARWHGVEIDLRENEIGKVSEPLSVNGADSLLLLAAG